MSQRVVCTRNRTIEEKIVLDVSAANPDDAVAVFNHLKINDKLNWKFQQTLETSEERIVVREVQQKKE